MGEKEKLGDTGKHREKERECERIQCVFTCNS